MGFDKGFKPKLKGYVHLIPTGQNLQVRWGEQALMITNEKAVTLIKKLISFLDGNYTIDDIVSQLEWDREDILDVLTFFSNNKLLEDASIVSPLLPQQEEELKDQISYLSRFSPNKYKLQEAISHTQVLVLGEGMLFQEVFTSLEKAGMLNIAVSSEEIKGVASFKRPESKADVKKILEKAGAGRVIVATLKPFSPLFSWVNTVCLTSNVIWTSCTVYGEQGLVGPTVIPGQTPCYTCYKLRRDSNLVHYDEFIQFETYMRENPEEQKSDGALVNTFSVLANITVLELIKGITGIGTMQTAGGQISYNSLTMELKIHPILKLPRCPDCGLPSRERETAKVWMK